VTKPPPGSATVSSPRLSIPFFTGPRNDAVVEAMQMCGEDILLRYVPVRVRDHLLK
jgi:isopenicillin N synthase-like dioxygenase